MKIVGLIPARYASSRFEGKPIAEICGRPMVWWVYQQLKATPQIKEAYVATDDFRIAKVCDAYAIPWIMTSTAHPTHLERLHEASQKIDADFYINVNGDEPLIESACIADMIPPETCNPEESYAANAMMVLSDPIDAVDSSKIKIATDRNGFGLYMARSPIPFPKGRGDYHLKKFVGIQCFTKRALQFCADTPRGELESIEDIDEFRFLENGHPLKFIRTNASTLSVDTPKDLIKVSAILEQRIQEGRFSFFYGANSTA